MGDVSKKLINQFATNLNTMLDESGPAAAEPAAAAEPTAAEPAGATEPTAASATTAPTEPATDQSAAAGEPKVRKINGPANEPIELTDVAGSAVLKRALPFIGGLVLLLLLLRFRRR